MPYVLRYSARYQSRFTPRFQNRFQNKFQNRFQNKFKSTFEPKFSNMFQNRWDALLEQRRQRGRRYTDSEYKTIIQKINRTKNIQKNKVDVKHEQIDDAEP